MTGRYLVEVVKWLVRNQLRSEETAKICDYNIPGKKEDCVIDHTCDTGFKTNWLFVCRIKYDMAAQMWNLQRSGRGVRILSKITRKIEQ